MNKNHLRNSLYASYTSRIFICLFEKEEIFFAAIVLKNNNEYKFSSIFIHVQLRNICALSALLFKILNLMCFFCNLSVSINNELKYQISNN